MKITTLQLPQQLKSQLAGIYYLSGTETLLLTEAKDLICQYADAAGFTEQDRLDVEPSFAWDKFLLSINNLSLFGDKKIIELHLHTAPNTTGSNILKNYVLQPQKNTVLVIINTQNNANITKQAWFKELLTNGIVVQTQDISPIQLPSWITNRAQQLGLNLDESGIQLLADYTSGNLHAVKHELEKLQLLYGQTQITLAQLTASISDSASFTVFDLLDSTLDGNINRTIRILTNLEESGLEPPLALWAISRELRNLINVHYTLLTGKTIEQAIELNGIWSKQKSLIKKAVTRHNLLELQQLLHQAKNIDMIIKGCAVGNAWLELNRLCFKLATKKPGIAQHGKSRIQ